MTFDWTRLPADHLEGLASPKTHIHSPRVDEKILWTGKPARSRLFLLTIIATIFFVVIGPSLILSGSLTPSQVLVVEILSVLLPAMTILLARLGSGINFYVTSESVVWERDFYLWSKTITLPIPSIISVYSTKVGKKGYVAFESPRGRYDILFRRLKDDPERVKELVMQAKSSVS